MKTDFIKRLKSIPTLPTVLEQIIKTVEDPRSSASDLEKLIYNDQALTTKLLAVSNSAYYGFRHQITTVRRAVVAIGFSEVRNICLGLSLMGFLHPSTFRDREAAEQLWLHSLAVSEACLLLAEETRSAEAGAAFTAGLLHDIGKVVLAAFLPDDVETLKRQVAAGKSFREAERQLDLSHEQVGGALALQWDLPPVLAEAIASHHTPNSRLIYYPLVSLVHVGDFMARSLRLGFSGDPDRPSLNPKAVEGLGMSRDTLQSCARRLNERRSRVEAYWRRMINPPSG